MFDQLVQTITDYPYIGVALVFLLCGLGLPLPEEIVLLAGGFVCAKYPEKAQLLPMMGWCAGAILVGDMIPFLLGRIFGVRLLRVRWLRYFITKQRLAVFDRWFRRRGDLVIVISRFVPGLRVVAFFTAGAMKMRIARFLLLDGIGIALIVPLLTWVGFRSKDFIDEAIEKVTTVERGILWGVLIGGAILALVIWWHRRRRQKGQRKKLGETYVQPKRPVQGPPSEAGGPTPAELAERVEFAERDGAEAGAEDAESGTDEPTASEEDAAQPDRSGANGPTRRDASPD